MRKTKYGNRAICKHCGQDIEFSGGHPKDWTDRGGNRECVPYIKKGEIVRPKTKHAKGA